MATVLDVAHFLIKEENRKIEGSMTNLRLNKLLYFAQVISMLEHGQPLFDDDFAAWDLGPVIPSIYRCYKQYGDRPIPTPEALDYSVFTLEEIRLLFDVSEHFKNQSTSALVDYSHVKDGPWWENHRKSNMATIPKEEMLSYYKLNSKAKSFPRKSRQLIDRIPEAAFVIREEDDRMTTES